MKKGFTLVELLGTITILGVIMLIVSPIARNIISDSKEELYEVQVSNIKDALKNWVVDNSRLLPENEGETITITLGQLKAGGYVEAELRNPKNNKCFGNDMLLTVTRHQKNYIYNVEDESSTETDTCDEYLKPYIILNGDAIVYVEVGEEYVDLGASAIGTDGVDISSNITTSISGSGDTIDTSVVGNSYTITYTVTEGTTTTSIKRKVIVNDTIPPELTIPDNVILEIGDTNLNAMEGVTATDNSDSSGSSVNITAKSNISFGIPGEYIITYIATDSSGNKVTKKRVVEILSPKTNLAIPDLKEGMIPVTITPTGIVKKASTTDGWYDYNAKKWANAILVTANSFQKYKEIDINETINEDDILAYFVWIPRYRYKLWNVEATSGSPDASKVHSIKLFFESKEDAKSDGTCDGTYKEPTNDCYLTHPAFTFGKEELDGIWVGKFETGYNGAASINDAQQGNADSTKVIIKPNVYSWRNMNLINMHTTAIGMNGDSNPFGLTINSDSHLMKNTEWGAVAYLSYSKYGNCNNDTCSEIHINNNNKFLTGCGGDSGYEAAVSDCKNQYSTKLDGIYNQSSNGNITGIFDLNGGATEYVLGYSIGATTPYSSSGFDVNTFPTPKYIDTYTLVGTTQYNDRILGDATGEMGPFSANQGSWYNDYAYFLEANKPWFIRGGNYNEKKGSGIFFFSRGDGTGNPYNSFRIVIS